MSRIGAVLTFLGAGMFVAGAIVPMGRQWFALIPFGYLFAYAGLCLWEEPRMSVLRRR